MQNSSSRLLVMFAFVIITILLVTGLVKICGSSKDGYKLANKKYNSISYVEKDPVRDTYPFEDTNY